MTNETTLNTIRYYTAIIPILPTLGLILNIIIFLIFSHSTFSKQNVYAFLKYEAFFIAVDLFINSFEFITVCPGIKSTYLAQVYFIYPLIISTSFFELSAIICHIISNMELILLISNKERPKLLQKLPNKIICLMVFLFSCVLYSYMFFLNYIKVDFSENNGFNQTWTQVLGYKLGYTEFNETSLKKFIDILVFVIRDGVCLAILVALNIVIFYKVKTALSKKKLILSPEQTSTSNNMKKKKLKSSNRKTSIMVIVISLSYTIGRLPYLVNSIIGNISSSVDILSFISVLCIFVSYDSYFFIYYFFNNRFRSLFKESISFFAKCRK
jgi:hypothetical protein